MSEQWPKSYLQTFGAFTEDSKSERYASALLDFHRAELGLHLPNPVRVLDLCCGTGLAGKAIQFHLGTVGLESEMTFVDSSAQILSNIQSDAKTRTICADVTKMQEVSSESIDVAICRYGFNNLPREHWLQALNETLRVLKPGGIFLLQDHFVPGPVFSALVNEAEQFLARLEGKTHCPFIFSTEALNAVLDEHPLVASRYKGGYGFFVNIWDRLRAKKELLPDFEGAKLQILRFYRDVCLEKYKVLIVDPDEYIHVYNVTYAIAKRS